MRWHFATFARPLIPKHTLLPPLFSFSLSNISLQRLTLGFPKLLENPRRRRRFFPPLPYRVGTLDLYATPYSIVTLTQFSVSLSADCARHLRRSEADATSPILKPTTGWLRHALNAVGQGELLISLKRI